RRRRRRRRPTHRPRTTTASSDAGRARPTLLQLTAVDPSRPGLRTRLFGTREFERLWIAQVVSATGDWLGFLAIAILATQVGAEPGAAVGLVMAARLVPGFFLAPV